MSASAGALHPEERGLLGDEVVQEAIVLVDAGGGARGTLQLRRAAHMVEVRMRVDDRRNLDAERGEPRLDVPEVASRIHDNGAFRLQVGDDGTVAAEGADGHRLDVHG